MNNLLTQDAVTPPPKSTRKPKLTPEERRERILARHFAGTYYRRGKIDKRPCFLCESKELLEFHHPDYAEPLGVVCLCRAHHQMLTLGKLSLIPAAVHAQLRFDKAVRKLDEQINIARIVRRINRAIERMKS